MLAGGQINIGYHITSLAGVMPSTDELICSHSQRYFFILSTLLSLKFPLSGSLYQTEGTSRFGEVMAGQQWARGCKLKPTQRMRKDELLVGVAAVPSIIPCKNFG